jgi:voltage-gated potassium channel
VPGEIRIFFKKLIQYRYVLLALAFFAFFISTSWLFWYFESKIPEQAERLKTPLDVVYWWVITCTTIGYGDISPLTQPGKALVIVVSFVGMAMVGTLVARLGTLFFEKRIQALKGLGNMEHQTNHIIICGWQEGLIGVIQSLLDMHSGITPDRLLLLNNEPSEKINALQNRKDMTGLGFVAGDITDIADLNRAGVADARFVMILASRGDSAPDSKTLLCVMGIRQISKTLHICAEVSEDRFVNHLISAGCNELIHLSSLRRSLVALSMVKPGMGNILHSLITPDQDARVEIRPIELEHEGQAFGILQQKYAEQDNEILIGLLENVGNPYELKQEALRNAQKTPDISTLVHQLKDVKQLSPNKPLLCPANDYIIRPRTQAVILRRKPAIKKEGIS